MWLVGHTRFWQVTDAGLVAQTGYPENVGYGFSTGDTIAIGGGALVFSSDQATGLWRDGTFEPWPIAGHGLTVLADGSIVVGQGYSPMIGRVAGTWTQLHS